MFESYGLRWEKNVGFNLCVVLVFQCIDVLMFLIC